MFSPLRRSVSDSILAGGPETDADLVGPPPSIQPSSSCSGLDDSGRAAHDLELATTISPGVVSTLAAMAGAVAPIVGCWVANRSSAILSTAGQEARRRTRDVVAAASSRLDIRRTRQRFAVSSLGVADLDLAMNLALRRRVTELNTTIQARGESLKAEHSRRIPYECLAESAARTGTIVGSVGALFALGAISARGEGWLGGVLVGTFVLVSAAALACGGMMVAAQARVRASERLVSKMEVEQLVDRARLEEIDSSRDATHRMNRHLLRHHVSQAARECEHYLSEEADDFTIVHRGRRTASADLSSTAAAAEDGSASPTASAPGSGEIAATAGS